jgi:UDP:flavonoid glycosyltransferase YjiC (YdhE family)
VRVFQSLLAFSGNAPPQLAVTRCLVERGHEVHVLAHRAGRERVERTGATVIEVEGSTADLDLTRAEGDPVRDWAAKTPLGAAVRLRDGAMIDPLPEATRQCAALLRTWSPDVVVFDWLFLGAAVAAESADIPAAALVHCPYPLPISGAPPLFSGMKPMAGVLGSLRDRAVNGFFRRFSAAGLPQLNQVRAEHGLAPLHAWEDQLRSVAGLYVLTAPELDFAGSLSLPANVHYVGPAFEHYDDEWSSPWPPEDPDPLILVSFSTSYMNQNALAQRVLDAVAGLKARVLFTAGPAIDVAHLRLPANTRAEQFVPHRAVLPETSLVVTHAGWQTVNAALSCGVPLVCIPDGRDQPDNAVRVEAVGAGVRVSKRAPIAKIRRAVEHALADPGLTRGAKLMATALSRQDGALATATDLERLVKMERHERIAASPMTEEPTPC